MIPVHVCTYNVGVGSSDLHGGFVQQSDSSAKGSSCVIQMGLFESQSFLSSFFPATGFCVAWSIPFQMENIFLICMTITKDK